MSRRLASSSRAVVALVAGATLLAAPAFAEKTIWKYDDLPGDMVVLADGLKKHPMSAHPGFVKGEAFGQIYKPQPGDYPVKVLSVELVMAAAEKAQQPFPSVAASIEFYNDKDIAATPDAAPVWTINTADFFNSAAGQPGMDIQGNAAMIYEFDWSKPENHPPEFTSGNIRVVVRILSNASDTGEYWEPGCSKSGLGFCQCSKIKLGEGLETCGCQQLAALTDSGTTPKANVLHIVYPLGTCSGSKQWVWLEDIAKEGKQMKGDFLLRLGVEGTGGGGTGGDLDAGTSDTGGKPDVGELDTASQMKPVVLFVTPAAIDQGVITEIEIVGEQFQQGAKVEIGATSIPVSSVTATKMKATVTAAVPVGKHPVLVTNPNGQVGYKQDAFTVVAKAVEDASDGAAADSGSVDAGVALGPLSIDLVDPKCVESSLDTQITVFGSGFTDGMVFELSGQKLLAVNVLSPSKASALVPKGLPRGLASLVASRPDGKAASLANAIQVGCNAGGGQTSSGCSAGVKSAPHDARSMTLLALGILTMLGLWRRRARSL